MIYVFFTHNKGNVSVSYVNTLVKDLLPHNHKQCFTYRYAFEYLEM